MRHTFPLIKPLEELVLVVAAATEQVARKAVTVAQLTTIVFPRAPTLAGLRSDRAVKVEVKAQNQSQFLWMLMLCKASRIRTLRL
jgi:hypothetical protein